MFYIVELNFNKFRFTNYDDARMFAEMAKLSAVNEKYEYRQSDVSIKLHMNEEEKKDGQ